MYTKIIQIGILASMFIGLGISSHALFACNMNYSCGGYAPAYSYGYYPSNYQPYSNPFYSGCALCNNYPTYTSYNPYGNTYYQNYPYNNYNTYSPSYPSNYQYYSNYQYSSNYGYNSYYPFSGTYPVYSYYNGY